MIQGGVIMDVINPEQVRYRICAQLFTALNGLFIYDLGSYR